MSQVKSIGTKEEVWEGKAERTAGGLKKEDLVQRIMSKNKVEQGRRTAQKRSEKKNSVEAKSPPSSPVNKPVKLDPVKTRRPRAKKD